MSDHYETLGVDRDATDEEIKRSYKKLARTYHPDLNPGDADAEARFKDIGAAYDVLSDRERRARYDRFGTDDPAAADPFGGGDGGGGD
jgi:DnaJ-class molecular chaperone